MSKLRTLLDDYKKAANVNVKPSKWFTVLHYSQFLTTTFDSHKYIILRITVQKASTNCGGQISYISKLNKLMAVDLAAMDTFKERLND